MMSTTTSDEKNSMRSVSSKSNWGFNMMMGGGTAGEQNHQSSQRRRQPPNVMSDQERNTLRMLEERRKLKASSKKNSELADTSSITDVSADDDTVCSSNRRKESKQENPQKDDSTLSQGDLIHLSTLIPLGMNSKNDDDGVTGRLSVEAHEEDDLKSQWLKQKDSQSYFTNASMGMNGGSKIDEDKEYFNDLKTLLMLKQKGQLDQSHLIKGTMRIMDQRESDEEDLNELWNDNREVDQARLILRSTGNDEYPTVKITSPKTISSSPSSSSPAAASGGASKSPWMIRDMLLSAFQEDTNDSDNLNGLLQRTNKEYQATSRRKSENKKKKQSEKDTDGAAVDAISEDDIDDNINNNDRVQQRKQKQSLRYSAWHDDAYDAIAEIEESNIGGFIEPKDDIALALM